MKKALAAVLTTAMIFGSAAVVSATGNPDGKQTASARLDFLILQITKALNHIVFVSFC